MTREELENALKVGSVGVCVDVSRMHGFPSRVREVTILKGLRVTVEFNVYGYDEGGPRYVAEYGDLDQIVTDLVVYLGKDLADWENHTASGAYPDPPDGWTGTPSDVENAQFVAYLASGQMKLPSARFEQRSSYWRKLEADGGSS